MRGAAMRLNKAVRGFVVVVLSVSVVLGQYGWGVTYTSTPICAVKGSTVEIRCTYTYPSRQYNPYRVVRTFWLTKESNNEVVDLKTDPEYSGRVQYQCENNDCTLRITDLRESDSAEYKFRFITNDPRGKYTGVPGVTLTVTDLKCKSSCPLPDNLSYIWYKNEQIITGQTSNSYTDYWDPTNRISCAVRGYENSRSPSVEIRCTFRYPSTIDGTNTKVDKTFWFISVRNNEPVDLTTEAEYSGRVHYQCKNNDCTLRISDLRESDSAEYKFRFITYNKKGKYSGVPGVPLTVTDAPKLPSVSVSPSAEIVEGSSVTLTCSSDANPAASYTWYKEDVINPLSYQNQHVFSSILPSDSGKYYCTADNNLGQKRSESRTIDVKYPPRLPSVSVSPSAEIVEGSSVTLTCSSDANPAANYTWYKDNKVLSAGQQNVYHFIAIKLENSGNYSCKSENQYGQKNSTSLSIDVQYPPKLPSVSVSPSAEIVEGSSVTLTCSSDANPAANYTWYKEDEDSPKTSGHNFTISNIRPEHSGSYYCVAHNNRGTHNVTLQLTVREGTFFISLTHLLIRCHKPLYIIMCPKFNRFLNSLFFQSPPSHSEEDEELNYASVRFSTNQTDPIYYNIRSAGSRRQKVKEEDEHVEYAAVNFSSAPR
ncbi:BTB/POZ domain-containing protein KCTD1/15 [Sarotherodon galilaeus]